MSDKAGVIVFRDPQDPNDGVLRSRRTHRLRRDERGAAMVEMAIVTPLLIILVFGIIQFGIAFNRVQGLHAAAREGARTASIPTNNAGDVQARVDEALLAMNFIADPASVTPNSCSGNQGDSITVTVTAPYTVSIPLLPDVPVTLTGEGVFRCE